jgi:hypothetical protein
MVGALAAQGPHGLERPGVATSIESPVGIPPSIISSSPGTPVEALDGGALMHNVSSLEGSFQFMTRR